MRDLALGARQPEDRRAQDQRSGQLPEARRRSARFPHRHQHAGGSGRRPEDLAADRRPRARKAAPLYVRKPAEAASALVEPSVSGRSRSEALDRPAAHRHPRRRTCTTSPCKPAQRPGLSTDAGEARRCRSDPEPDSEGPQGREHAGASTARPTRWPPFTSTTCAPLPAHRPGTRWITRLSAPSTARCSSSPGRQGFRQGVRQRHRQPRCRRWPAQFAPARDSADTAKPAAASPLQRRPRPAPSRGPGCRAARRARQGPRVRDPALQVRVDLQAAGRSAREKARPAAKVPNSRRAQSLAGPRDQRQRDCRSSAAREATPAPSGWP